MFQNRFQTSALDWRHCNEHHLANRWTLNVKSIKYSCKVDFKLFNGHSTLIWYLVDYETVEDLNPSYVYFEQSYICTTFNLRQKAIYVTCYVYWVLFYLPTAHTFPPVYLLTWFIKSPKVILQSNKIPAVIFLFIF